MYGWALIFLLVIIVIVIVLVVVIAVTSEDSIHQMCHPKLYQAKFHETAFPPITRKKRYYERVRKGYKTMKGSSIAIMGLAYNLGTDMSKMLVKRLYHLVKPWRHHCIILYAADSQDDTYSIIQEEAEKYNLNVCLPTCHPNKEGLKRIDKMVVLRNICLDYLKDSGYEPEYAMFIDCDLTGPISIDGIAHSISYMDLDVDNRQRYIHKYNKYSNFDAMFANGMVNYLVFNCSIPGIGWTYYDGLAFESMPSHRQKLAAGFTIAAKRGENPIRVQAAFGGAGIYKYKVLKKYSYKFGKRCEHTSIHEPMFHDGYQLAINPSLILLSGIQGEGAHKAPKK